MKLFLQKNAKFLSAGGSTPVPPAAGGFAPKPPASGSWELRTRPPLASGGWGLRPQTPQIAPTIANFWLRVWTPVALYLEF